MAISKIENASLASGVPTRAQLPAGTVLQVVNAASKTYFTSASTTYVDVTNLTASITPTSATSKILVRVGLNGLCTNTNSATSYETFYQLTDGSGTLITGIWNSLTVGANETYGLNAVTYEFLHSPATTSSITYKIQGKGDGSSHGFQINNYFGTTSYTGSYITLMEIAQ